MVQQEIYVACYDESSVNEQKLDLIKPLDIEDESNLIIDINLSSSDYFNNSYFRGQHNFNTRYKTNFYKITDGELIGTDPIKFTDDFILIGTHKNGSNLANILDNIRVAKKIYICPAWYLEDSNAKRDEINPKFTPGSRINYNDIYSDGQVLATVNSINRRELEKMADDLISGLSDKDRELLDPKKLKEGLDTLREMFGK